MLQDRHLFLRPVMHTNVVTHHIAAKDSCIPLAFFFDCQWLNVNGSPMFFLEICFIIIAFLICLCLCSCSYKEKNHRSARSAYAIQALATDLMPQMDRGSSHVDSHAEKVGLVSLPFDITIQKAMQKGQVWPVILSPPCSVWSRAQRGNHSNLQILEIMERAWKVGWPRPLRSTACIWENCELHSLATIHFMSVPAHKDRQAGCNNYISNFPGVTNSISRCNRFHFQVQSVCNTLPLCV